MHILFITRYYYPEKAAAAVCVGETAKRLLHHGHQVTVLTTFPNYPNGIVPIAYRGHLRQTEIIEGIRVVRTWSYTSPNRGFVKRILAYLSFGCLAAFLGHKAIPRPDIIIVESPPLLNVIAAHILTWFTQRPYIFWVADLWPASAIELGALRNRILIKLATWLESITYRRARLIWTVTEGMRETLIQRGLAEDKVFLLYNGVDTQKFRPQSQIQARQKWNWGNDFVVLYAGTHGLTHGLSTLLDAAEQLCGQLPVRFIMVGDGAEKAHLIATAHSRRLSNVQFLDPVPHEQMPTLLAACDICLAQTRNLPIFAAMLPIKMLEAMASGRPLLLAVNGEARRIAEQEAKAAIYCEPENAEALATTIRYLHAHPEIVKQLGQNGHTYIQEHFDYANLTAKLNTQLQRMQKDKSHLNPNIHVCMHVIRGTDHDVRLRRTATALTDAGYHVTIVDIIDPSKHIDTDTTRSPQTQPYTIQHIAAPCDFQNRRFEGLSRWQTLNLAIHAMITVLKQPADIYHACEWTALPACYAAAILHHKPLIYEAYELPLQDKSLINMSRSRRLLYAGIQFFLKHVLPCCAAVITVSPPIVQEMQRKYHIPHVTLIRNISSYRAPAKTNLLIERLHLSEHTRIALYQGNLQPDRGLDRLVQAAAYLDPEHMLVLMGQNIGTTQAELEQLIALDNSGSHVKIIPAVPYESLLDWTASADIGLTIIPLNYTRNMKMCLPNKLFEYIQAGLPVLSSPLEAVQEILTTYDVGKVIHATKPADIGAAINAMLNDPSELQRMHNNALKAAQRDLCWEKESQQLIQLYQQIATGIQKRDAHRN